MKTEPIERNTAPFKRILVPIDFSTLSRSAAMYALQIADRLKAHVELVSVIEVLYGSSTMLNWKKLEDQMVGDADAQGESVVRDLKKVSPGVDISYSTIIGSAIEESVLKFADDHDIDLIVMGTRGASGLKAAIIGSNAAALINRGDIPIIAIPDDLMHRGFKKIVMASDLVDLNLSAKEIVKFATFFDAQVDILHMTDKFVEPDLQARLEAALREMTGYRRLNLYIFKGDDLVTALNTYVVEQCADLLVMFTHELGVFEKLFGKGNTRKMAFHSEVPLLAMKKEQLLKVQRDI